MTPSPSPSPRSTQKEVVRLAREAAGATDPQRALRAVASLRGCLDALEAEHVDTALAAGNSWRVIAEALGVTRQAAHRRHTARMVAAAQQAREASVAGNRLVIVGAARVAVVMAREEAAGAHSPNVGTEHLLAGLVRARGGLAAQALITLGVTLEKVRHCAQASADRAHGHPETADHALPGTPKAQLPFSRRGREALEQALREAVRLGDDHLGVEHLLLALLRDGESRAVECLRRLRITPEMVEDELRRRSLLPAPTG